METSTVHQTNFKASSLWRYFNFTALLIFFSTATIVLLSILLSGCTSNSMKTVYLLSLSYHNGTQQKADVNEINGNVSIAFENLVKSATTLLEVRAGYIGICINERASGWVCSTDVRQLGELSRARGVDDPLNLIWIAGKFKDEVVFDGTLFTALPFFLITIIAVSRHPGWREETDEGGSIRDVKPFPSKFILYVALATIAIASIFSFISVFWQHISSAGTASLVQSLTYGYVNGRVGTTAMVLGWIGVFFGLIVAVGLILQNWSIKVLIKVGGGKTETHGETPGEIYGETYGERQEDAQEETHRDAQRDEHNIG